MQVTRKKLCNILHVKILISLYACTSNTNKYQYFLMAQTVLHTYNNENNPYQVNTSNLATLAHLGDLFQLLEALFPQFYPYLVMIQVHFSDRL